MRAIDRWAIEERGIPSLDLMERAGAGLALTVDRLVPRGPVAVVCGKGNNGGDGFVAGTAARRAAGATVRVLTLAEPDEYRGDAAENLRRLEGAHEPFAPRRARRRGGRSSTRSSARASTASRAARPRTRSRRSRCSTRRSSSADVASGVDASTGEAARRRVRATRDRDVRGRQAGALDRAGQAAHRRAARHRHRDPGGRARRGATSGCSRARVHALVPGRDAPGTKFTLRPRRRRGRLARADRRAVPGRARRRCAPAPATSRRSCPRSLELDLRDAPAGGHDARAARRRTAR